MIRIREYIRMMTCARRVSRQKNHGLGLGRPAKDYIVVDRGLYLQLLKTLDELTCIDTRTPNKIKIKKPVA